MQWDVYLFGNGEKCVWNDPNTLSIILMIENCSLKRCFSRLARNGRASGIFYILSTIIIYLCYISLITFYGKLKCSRIKKLFYNVISKYTFFIVKSNLFSSRDITIHPMHLITDDTCFFIVIILLDIRFQYLINNFW